MHSPLTLRFFSRSLSRVKPSIRQRNFPCRHSPPPAPPPEPPPEPPPRFGWWPARDADAEGAIALVKVAVSRMTWNVAQNDTESSTRNLVGRKSCTPRARASAHFSSARRRRRAARCRVAGAHPFSEFSKSPMRIKSFQPREALSPDFVSDAKRPGGQGHVPDKVGTGARPTAVGWTDHCGWRA